MAASGVILSGWTSNLARLAAMSASLEKAASNEGIWVGTHIWYAIFSEFGTERGVRPYSWFRHAIGTAASRSGVFGSKKFEFEAFALAPTEALLEPLAEIVVENAKRNIRRFGLIESGDLERSIAYGRTVPELVRNSRAATT